MEGDEENVNEPGLIPVSKQKTCEGIILGKASEDGANDCDFVTTDCCTLFKTPLTDSVGTVEK